MPGEKAMIILSGNDITLYELYNRHNDLIKFSKLSNDGDLHT